MNRQFQTFAVTLGLMSGQLIGCAVNPQSSHVSRSPAGAAPAVDSLQAMQACPRQFAGWSLIRTFRTAHYALALCQNGPSLYLVGYEKHQPDVVIEAPAQIDGKTVSAKGHNRFSFEIRQGVLTVKQNGTVMVQEPIGS